MGKAGTLEDMRFDKGFERWMGLLKVDIGQIDIFRQEEHFTAPLFRTPFFKASFTST